MLNKLNNNSFKSKFNINYLMEFLKLLTEFVNNPIIYNNINASKQINELLKQQMINMELAKYMQHLSDITQKSITLLSLFEKEHVDEKHIC